MVMLEWASLPGWTREEGTFIHVNLESSGVVAARAASSTSPQPKSDLSDFGQSKRPNSGKPEFGWGEGAHRARGTAADPLGRCWNGSHSQAEPRSNRFI